MDFKTSIAENIANIVNIDFKEISDFVEVPKEKSNGDFSFPCFKLAKNLKTLTVEDVDRYAKEDIRPIIKYDIRYRRNPLIEFFKKFF